MIKKIISKIMRKYAEHKGGNVYINHLRSMGIKIGENCIFRSPRTTRIDLTRPSLIEIGDNVDMNMNFQILTHDWASGVFRNKYYDLVPSSGKVKIGNNIYFGTNVIVLKGVTIGDNCIIAAGSVITKDIPANSVAGGIPAKVICSLDEYYEKRKAVCIEEAFEYAKSIKERYNRRPTIDDFHEEFVLFIDGKNKSNHTPWMVSQLGGEKNYNKWCQNHNAIYKDIDEFLRDAGLNI